MKTKPHPVYIVSLEEHEFDYDVFVAMEMCDLSEEELDKALDPSKMTKGGFVD